MGCMHALATIFRDGGWSMFVIVLCGFAALATAAFYAVRPDERHEGFVKWMSRATLWAVLAGICSDFATVFHAICEMEDANRRTQILIEGAAESLSPGIMGFAMLALAAMLTAVGRRRLDGRRA
jgi:hypothetical protein